MLKAQLAILHHEGNVFIHAYIFLVTIALDLRFKCLKYCRHLIFFRLFRASKQRIPREKNIYDNTIITIHRAG